MKHTEVALKRPIATTMAFVALALVGLVSVNLLPLEKFPDIEFPGLFVQVPYPGSTPEEIERLITRPLEESLATLSGVERMQSTTDENQAEIWVEFGWEADMAAKGIEARAKVDSIRGQLPPDIERILVFTGSFGDEPILNLRISADRDLSDAYDLLDRNLKRRVERLEGVSRVELQGVDPREVRILLDADRIAAHSVDLQDLRDRLQKSNFSVSAGSITDNNQRFSIRPQGEFGSLEDIRDTLINSDGLRLRDVADVTMLSPDRNYGRHLDMKYAIGLNVFKTTGANMVAVNDRVMAELEEIRKLPQMQGIKLFELDNSAEGVRSSLTDLRNSGLIGLALAIFVLFLFLRQFATTLIVALAVPFSLLITLGAMYFFGLSLNILSMMGLMLAVGMLVDNGVVITESIFRYRLMHPDKPFQATIDGVNEVGLAVIAGTATSIIVFAPIMFGTKADITVFLTHVALTISVALVASLLIAQTLIPMLASRLPPPKPPKKSALMTRLTNRYVRLLDGSLHHKWKTAGAILLIVVVGFLPLPLELVKFDAWPQENSRRLYLPYHIEGTHPLDRVESVVYRMEQFLYDHQEELDIISVYSYYEPDQAASSILLTDDDEITRSTKDIIDFITENMPEIVIGEPSFKFEQDGGGEGFSLQVTGDSTEKLSEISTDLLRVLGTIDGLEGLRSDAAQGDQEVRITVNRERAMRAGLAAQDVATAVAIAMRGEPLREFRGQDGEIGVRMTFRENDRQTIEQLAGLPLYTADNERIPLSNVASLHVQRGEQSIRRTDRQTAASVSADLKDTTLDEVKPQIEALMAEYSLPPGYSWKFGRGFDRNDETQKIMLENILLGIALIFIVMAALFESTLYPISIITSILFSVIGVFWFFALTGTTFSFMASIGIMILIGVVVNNGIVLVDHINNLRAEGVPRDEAIMRGAGDRLRPILMTVATTILGLMPLAMGNTQIGGDGPPYYPMARAIIGGLAFSTVTSLFVVPSVYVWFDNLSRWWRKVLRTVTRGAATA
ncbi:MAG: efflux RND transporter permease subunit [Pseudomonadota bacterium]